MLLSCMSSNIAQISRWWVAKSILSRDFNQYPFLTVLHHPNNFIPSPWNQISDPVNLAPLHIAPTLATTQDTLPIDRVPNTQVPSPSAYHLEPSILYIHHSQQTDLCNTHLPFLQNMKGYSGHQPKLVTQKRITNWTIHRHFILGVCNSQIVPPARNFSSQDGDITSRGTSKPVTGPFSPTKDDGDYNGTTPINQILADHLIPFGAPLPPVDNPNILQICLQNTKHSFQLFGEDIESPNILKNLKSFGVSMFVPISPNVNWTVSTI
jgi:hypothetical protein